MKTCINWHPRTSENTYLSKSKHNMCRICRRNREKDVTTGNTGSFLECNTGLGSLFKDIPELLKEAVSYLENSIKGKTHGE